MSEEVSKQQEASRQLEFRGTRLVRDTLKIPLRITDTTLRDAHQSLWATRMRTSDIMKIINTIDAVGYYSLEVWGGATFDVCLRFLRENPWERLRQIKSRAKKTPLQMLLRGQNILGYKNYPDDLLERLIALACENGIDIFRIFDALNDVRNLEQAIKCVKKHGGHAQGTICYTISPVHTVKEFVRVAKQQVEMGIDSLAIKDMAGILSPIAAEQLVSALVKAINVPVQVHSHATSGMASSSYVEAVRAGAGAIDCAISPMAGFSSLPPVEAMLAIFNETPYHANLDMMALKKICDYFESLAPERQPDIRPVNAIDPEILIHHIPGGMISNLRSQLKQQNALDRLDEVLDELPRVREDLGFPPLVTPTSQILGVQAVLNILAGERYKMVPQETRDYVKGLYGRSPAPINPEVRRKILGKEKAIVCRPADLLQPALPQATLNIEPGLIKAEEDIISYCLFPEVALEYFRWRNLPPEERPSPPADLERKKTADSKIPTPPPARQFLAETDYREINSLLQKVQTMGLSELTIRRNDLTLSLKASGATVAETPVAVSKQATVSEATAVSNVSATITPEVEKKPDAPSGPTVNSPLAGKFYLSSAPGKPPFAKPGDSLKEGDTVCIVEAMKLFNPIKALFPCKFKRYLIEHGANVKKDDPMFEIEK